MAIDSYMVFKGYDSKYLASESTVDLADAKEELAKPFKDAGKGNIFEVEDYSFDIEQTLNIGSQSTGAGAGKVTFNPFSITRKIDKSSPNLFANACQGKAFAQVQLGLRKAAGSTMSGIFFLRFDFKLVAVKTISWAHDDESPKETVTFEYGGLQIRYAQQLSDSSFGTVVPAGWNRTTNTIDVSSNNISAS